MCVQCGQCGKCGNRDQSRIFGRTWQRNGSFAGSLERQWAMGKEEQDVLKKYLFLEPKSTKVCDLLMFPAHLGKNIFDQGCRKHFPGHKIIWSLKKDWTSLIFSRYMKRKARRCDSYLQIWNYESLTDWLTFWPTDRGRCWEMLSHIKKVLFLYV